MYWGAMRYLVDLVEKVIGGNDREAVDAKMNASPESLFADICTGYSEWTAGTPQLKHAGEFVPGWRLDVHEVGRPYGRDPHFVTRAILYSHRLALADPLHFYTHPLSGPPGLLPSTLREDLHKILFYGPWSEQGFCST
jgi:hypothetical protein